MNIAGKVGVGTWNTSAEFDDIKVMDGSGKVLFSDDFSGTGNWSIEKGAFEKKDGCYVQTNNREEGALSLASQAVAGKVVYALRARKISGDEGFLIPFGYKDSENMYWWNIGGWGNKRHGIEFRDNNGKTLLTSAGGGVETGKWYDIRIETEGPLIRCFLDGKKVHEFNHAGTSKGIAVSSTYDERSKEVILKIVNPRAESLKTGITLHGISSAGDTAQSVVLSAEKGAQNSFENRNVVAPQAGTIPAGRAFIIEVKPVSVQILRIPVKK